MSKYENYDIIFLHKVVGSGFLRKIFLFLIITVSIISLFSISAYADNTVAIGDVNSNSSGELVAQVESSQDLSSICADLVKSTQSWVSLIMIIFLALYVLLFKKDMPKIWKLIVPAVLIIVTFGVRLSLYFKCSDFLLTLIVTGIQIIYFLILIRFWKKTQTITHETAIPKNALEKKACTVIQKLLNKSHYAIECIQLYTIQANTDQTITSFQIDFLGGSSKQGVNINALFSTSLKIPTEHITSMETIQTLYTQFIAEGNVTESQENAVSVLILNEIKKLKQTLNGIKSTNEISENECYLARILLVYLSLYATINEHDTYIGLGRECLDLKNPDLEPLLFTYERTGILGAILLNQIPYVFSYRRGGGKTGRFYYTFSCGSKKKYIVLVSMKNKNKSYYIDNFMANNIKTIRQQLIKILNPNNASEKVGD